VTDRFELPAALRDDIVAHARADAPKEACGLVAGRDARATRVIRCLNAHPAAVTRYTIDPREQLRAFRDMEANGEELLAIYHSHPATQAYPSPTDRAESHYPEAIYVLVSLRDATPDVRAFQISDGWVREVVLA
jgi:proteasome lid subunit RPN8/RPN11